jgi:hypothetical protein
VRPHSLILTLAALPQLAAAQTAIGGIINSYYKVVEVIPVRACVRVDNTAGLSANDFVLLIQMKGADVNTANNASFGSVTSLNNAGNYELNTICSIRGDSLFFFRQLAQSYTVSGKVQLVRIPEYASANVTSPLQAQAWDSAAGKGGVLALSVQNNLVLQAPVSASGAGYAGGAFLLSNGTCSNFFPAASFYYNAAPAAPQEGAYKGEGVAGLIASYSGGKGAAANGGGGGNNHNNGGGGGAHLSTGGLGGGNSSAAGCRVANAGIGGYALSNSGGTKLFMGGGGGAGHANNSTATGGGDGGGIVLIFANTLISNGYLISANGVEGSDAVGDGASGGGAGGTILLNINNYADAVNVEAKGGDGGDEDDQATAQRCYGEGGGGSGGVVYCKTALPAGSIRVIGGSNGLRLNSLNCSTLVMGSSGGNGYTFANYSYVQSSVLSATCGVALDVRLLAFDVWLSNRDVQLHWLISGSEGIQEFAVERKRSNEGWEVVSRLTPIQNHYTYQYRERLPAEGEYFYRLKIQEQTGVVRYSAVRRVALGAQAALIIYPNPASQTFTLAYPLQPGMQVKFYDELGRLVWSKIITVRQALLRQNISFLNRGIYTVEVEGKRARLMVH